MPLALGVMPARFGLPCLTIRHPRLTLRGHTVGMPGLRATSAATGWAALDTVTGCVALRRAVAFRIASLSRSAGLRQFKSSFAPGWRPLCFASPSRLALVVGLLDIARVVLLPSRVPDRGSLEDLSRPHDEDEYYEIASNAAA